MNKQSLTRRLATGLIPLAAILAASHLFAETPSPVALSGSAEVPPVTTTATGMVKISVMPNRSVSGKVEISGMVPTMAHIHEGAVGKNGPPIITLVKNSDKEFAVPADAKLTEAQYSSFMSGNLYVNVHSQMHPDGEIRAQLPGKPMRIAN
jgi:hypothetical protein